MSSRRRPDPPRAAAYRLATLLAVAVLCSSAAYAQAPAAPPPEAYPVLEWAPVEGARSYEVAVRLAPSGTEVYRVTVETNRATLPLGPGEYEVRITAFNVFRKPFVTGSWTAFTVKRTADIGAPRIDEASLYSGSGSGTVTVDASGILPDTTARLEGAGAVIRASSATVQDGELSLEFDLEGAPAGSYDLVLENPGGLTARLPGAAVVLPRTQPGIVSIDPTEMDNDRAYPWVTVRGSGFSADTALVLTGPGGAELRPSRVLSVSETEMVVVLNMADRPGGIWDVTVSNPGGLSATLADAVTVRDALAAAVEAGPPAAAPPVESPAVGDASPDKETANEPAEIIELPTAPETIFIEVPATRRPASLYVAAGWSPGIVLAPYYEDAYGMTYAGACMALGIFPGSGWWTARPPVSIALEARVFADRYEEAVTVPGTSASLAPVSAELAAALNAGPFGPFGMRLRAAYGVAFSFAARTGPLGTFTGWSYDPALSAGASLYLALGPVVLEAGADLRLVPYVGEAFYALVPWATLGWYRR